MKIISCGTKFIVGYIFAENYSCQFLSALSYLRENNFISKGIIVINHEIEKENEQECITNGIHLISYIEFLSHAYNYEDACRKIISRYENEEIFQKSLYIKLRGKKENSYECFDLESYFEEWLSGDGVQITLLGDFGVGKTTFSKKIEYNLAKKI